MAKKNRDKETTQRIKTAANRVIINNPKWPFRGANFLMFVAGTAWCKERYRPQAKHRNKLTLRFGEQSETSSGGQEEITGW